MTSPCCESVKCKCSEHVSVPDSFADDILRKKGEEEQKGDRNVFMNMVSTRVSIALIAINCGYILILA